MFVQHTNQLYVRPYNVQHFPKRDPVVTLFFGPEPRLASLNPETVKVHESCLGLSRVRPYARAIHV